MAVQIDAVLRAWGRRGQCHRPGWVAQGVRSHSPAGWDPALSLPALWGKQTPVWQKMLCRTLMSTTWRLLLRRELGVAWKLPFNNGQRKKKRFFFCYPF